MYCGRHKLQSYIEEVQNAVPRKKTFSKVAIYYCAGGEKKLQPVTRIFFLRFFFSRMRPGTIVNAR